MTNKTQYERDMEIIEAATDGPWKYVETGDHYVIADLGKYAIIRQCSESSLYGRIPQGVDAVKADAEYFAHFNPSHTRQLVTELEAMRKRCDELEKTFSHIHVNNGVDDGCKQCGLDLRDGIHKRI